MAKSVRASQSLVGKTVNMLGGAKKEITGQKGTHGYQFADKTTLSAKLVRMFQRQFWEVAEEDFIAVKEVEDTEKGYAVYPKGTKFTEKKVGSKPAPAPKDNKPKPAPAPKDNKPKPAPAPKDNKPKLTVVPNAPVAHDRPDYEGKIEIKGFDKKTGQLIRTKLTQFLLDVLPENTEVRAVQVQIADNQRRMVISADLAMNTYDEAEAIRQMLEAGVITKIALKRMSAADIRELWEDEEVQDMLKDGEPEQEEEPEEEPELGPEDLSDEDDFSLEGKDPEDLSDEDDFSLEGKDPEDDNQDEVDPDFDDQDPEDLSDEEQEEEEDDFHDDEQEEQEQEPDSVYLHIALDKDDLAHSDNSLVAKNTDRFANELGIDSDEFYQGLVLENDDGEQFVYIGMKLNDKQQVTMLLKNMDTGSRKRVPLSAADKYQAVSGHMEAEDLSEEDFE